MSLRSFAPKLPRPSTCLNLLRSSSPITQQQRQKSGYPPRPVPAPTPFVPDVPTFLRLIGRQLSQHAPKFESWESLFNMSSQQMRDLGLEPARSRRYLLWWREKFRRGEFGIGGDMKHVKDGVGEVRVVGVKGRKAMAVNTPIAEEGEQPVVPSDGSELTAIAGLKVRGPRVISGPHFLPVQGSHGSVARIEVKDGMWEVKRGRKIHGGERRRKYNLSVLRRKAKAAAA